MDHTCLALATAQNSTAFRRVPFPPLKSQTSPFLPAAKGWSSRPEVLEHALEQTKQSFPVPERWVPIAPTPVSAIEIELQIICDGFSGFGHFVDQNTWDFFRVATDATINSIESPGFARRGHKTGRKHLPRFAERHPHAFLPPAWGRCRRRRRRGLAQTKGVLVLIVLLVLVLVPLLSLRVVPVLLLPPSAFHPPPSRAISFCKFVARPYPTRVKGTHWLGRDGEPWPKFEAETSPPRATSLWSKIATERLTPELRPAALRKCTCENGFGRFVSLLPPEKK